MTEAYIFDAVRTPRGKGRSDGSLHEVKPVDLLGGLLDSLRERLGERPSVLALGERHAEQTARRRRARRGPGRRGNAPDGRTGRACGGGPSPPRR